MSAPPATMSALRSRVAFKQIHITTTPTPRNLAESRLVLQALQKFGEVVTFRNLRYDTTNTSPNRDRACLAIFDTADAARRAIEASPLTIPVPPETTETKKPAPGKAFADPWAHVDAEAEKPLRVLTCQIQHSLHSHESAMLRNPYHSAYYVLTNSFQYHDLTKSTGIPLPELADCLMGRKRHVPLRIKRRIQAENERLGATSLMKLYEEGLENERIRNANAAAADTKLQQHAQQGAQNAAAQARNAVPPQGSTIEKDGITAGKNNDANTKADEKKFPRPLAPEDELEAMRERWGVKGLLAE